MSIHTCPYCGTSSELWEVDHKATFTSIAVINDEGGIDETKESIEQDSGDPDSISCTTCGVTVDFCDGIMMEWG